MEDNVNTGRSKQFSNLQLLALEEVYSFISLNPPLDPLLVEAIG